MKLDNNYTVYLHRTPNNKVYIGITSKNVEDRWGKDGYNYRNQDKFYRAIKKYGWNNMKHIILFTNLSENEAKKKEIELISKYKSTNSKYGYNVSIGGDYTTKGYKFTNKQRNNLSKAKTEPIYCIEENKIYYSGKELRKNGFSRYRDVCLGKRATSNDKHFILLKDLDKFKRDNINFKKTSKQKVICLDNMKIYNSISEATKDLKCRQNCISECCTNKLKSTNKLHFQYYDKNISLKQYKNILERKKLTFTKIKNVKCIENHKIYNSIKEAQKDTKAKHIYECLNKKRKTSGGFHWEII